MRRLLLDPTSSFYHYYPNTCIFLIEEVFADIVGTKFCFGMGSSHSNTEELFIYYILNGKAIRESCPMSEVKGWPIPNSKYSSFQGMESESELRKIYGWPRITIKN